MGFALKCSIFASKWCRNLKFENLRHATHFPWSCHILRDLLEREFPLSSILSHTFWFFCHFGFPNHKICRTFFTSYTNYVELLHVNLYFRIGCVMLDFCSGVNMKIKKSHKIQVIINLFIKFWMKKRASFTFALPNFLKSCWEILWGWIESVVYFTSSFQQTKSIQTLIRHSFKIGF